MTRVRTPIVMDEDTKSSLEFKPNIPDLPEQERGTSPRLQYGIRRGVRRMDTPRREFSKLFYVIDQPEDNMEPHSLPWKEGSPAANTDSHHTDKKTILKVLLRREMLKVYAVAQSQANKASQPSSWGAEYATTDTSWESIYKRTILEEMSERFNVIAQREDNWDGLESKKPIEESLVRAKRLIEKLLDDILSAGYSWRRFKPLITSDEDGYTTVRWIGEGKRLHFQITEDEVEYITLERINTKRKMGGDTIGDEQCFETWEWLING